MEPNVSLIERLEDMLAKGQDGALLRYGLGNEYLKLKQNEQAAQHLRRAVELDANYSAAWKQLGRALTAVGREHEALEAYRNGIRVAEEKGDVQAAREMRVFLKRLGG
jgi:Tfp pilus assembly protein PilF